MAWDAYLCKALTVLALMAMRTRGLVTGEVYSVVVMDLRLQCSDSLQSGMSPT